MDKYLLGIDLGGTNLRIAVVSLEGKLIEEVNVKTESDKGPHHVIDNMIKICEGLLQKRNIEAIGIGAPGPLDSKRGIILNPPNLPGWDEVPLALMLEKALEKKVVLDNDANAAALAEATIGVGKGKESVFYMTISTGIGGGYVYRNQLIQGANFCAGEVGNMMINQDGPMHHILNIGSLESLASGTAVHRLGKEKLGLTGHAGEVFTLAMNGQQEAKEIVDTMLTYLAKGISNIVHTIDPHMIVLGGGVMQSKEYIMPNLIEKVNDYLYPQIRNRIQIECASLGTKAGVIGAALLAQQVSEGDDNESLHGV
ncbi:ROK family protein [Peribacillus muralis]|uniref:ROK family protein n=1 Tax=Peribacillus muralis TaxID=264697 RepID=UPI0007093FD1|nr:ROK family protein [Peribacillus muralis]